MYKLRLTKILAFCIMMVCGVACSDEDNATKDTKLESKTQELSFTIDFDQDWNALNSPAQSAAKIASTNYTIETGERINGQEVYLQATTINGFITSASRQIDGIVPTTATATSINMPSGPRKGRQINDVANFHNTFGLFGYTVAEGGTIDTPDFLYNQPLTRDGIKWKADISKEWNQENTTRFYAYAPYNGDGVTLSAKTKSGVPTISYATPEGVKGQQDLMVSTSPVDITGVPQTSMSIRFRHVLTAVRFKIGSRIQSGVIKKIELQNVKYKGTYNWEADTWDLNDETKNFFIEPNHVTIGADGESLEGTYVGSADETFFLPPQDVPDNALAIITLAYRENGVAVEKTLKANLKTLGQVATWQEGHTTTYSIRTSQYANPEYYFEVVEDALNYDIDGKNNNFGDNLPFTVVSYKQNASGVTPAKEPVEWNITGYSVDGGTTWTTTRPNWLTLRDGTSGGAQIVEEHPADMKERNTETEFSERKPVTDYDLSTHNFNYEVAPRNTANCYIVNRPGTYKLPLVYGNAIKNGTTNEVAYNPGSDSRFPTLYSDKIVSRVFVNHLDNPITDPWIKNNTGCTPSGGEIVWQDVNNLVENVRVDGDYLCFEMKSDNMRAGNSIIAVTDASGTILWSWHIWVTDKCAYKTWPSYYKDYYYSYASYYEPNDNVTQNCDFSKEQLLLGCIGQNFINLEPRKVWVKYEQAGTGYTDILLIKQYGQEEEVPLYNGTPLYYQWGRKDPMLRLNDTSTGNAVIYNASKEWRVEQVGENASDPRISIGTSIQNPNIMYAAKSKQYAWRNVFYDNNRMCNLWNSINRKFITCKRGENGSEGVSWPGNSEFEKSIYDPSPVGYHIADPLFFFYQGPYKDLAAGKGFLFYLSVNGERNATIYKTAGWRRYSDGAVAGTANFVTWTSVISHEDVSLQLGIEYCTPFLWNSSDWNKWGSFVTISSDFGSSYACPVIPIKDKDWPEGWDFQP